MIDFRSFGLAELVPPGVQLEAGEHALGPGSDSVNTRHPCRVGSAIDILRPFSKAAQGRLFRIVIDSSAGAIPVPAVGLRVVPLDRPESGVVSWGCFHSWFQDQAGRTPDSVAVVSQGESLSYSELNFRANQLAHHLRHLGVGPESRVALSLDRSLDPLVGMLAVLKAGGAFIPLDPSSPRSQLEFVLEDARPVVVLTAKSLAAQVPTTSASVFRLDLDWPTIAGNPGENPEGSVSPADAAYVIYTSGSTGRPKGVVVEHRQLVNYVAGILQALSMPSGLRFAMVSTFAADLGHTVVFPSLVTGGQLHVIASGTASDPDLLAAYFDRESIDVLKIVPAHLRTLLQSAGAAKASQCLPRRILVLGGEASGWGLIRQIREISPLCRIFNHYGPTETTIGVLVNDLQSPGSDLALESVPLGQPLANVTIHIVDPQLDPVGVGESGELLIGGASVARGYLNRAALTSEKFIPDPFAGKAGARLYRTGDRVRRHPDGEIEFLGRIDQQLKIRGYRVEPGEVEMAVSGHPAVAACAVVAQECEGGDKILAAFLVLHDQCTLAVEPLRRWVASSLLEHLIPSRFFVLGALPLTPNGKVDRKLLETWEGAALSPGTGYMAPRTDVESELATIWQAVLGLERVGIHDNFFDLGGHSLLAMRMTARIRVQGIQPVSLRSIFERPTIAELAAAVDDGRISQTWQKPPLAPQDRRQPLPLSSVQEQLWFIDGFQEGSREYNMPQALRLRGALDEVALARAINRIVERHETLRTVFLAQDGETIQVVLPRLEIPWTVEDLGDLESGAREQALAETIESFERRPFDLKVGPLFCVRLLRLADDDHVLLQNAHHIVADGWSWGVFNREMGALYEAFTSHAEDPLEPLWVQYGDYALWQREWLRGPAFAAELAHWKAVLAGAPERLELPSDGSAFTPVTAPCAVVERLLESNLVHSLQSIGSKARASTFTTLTAAFNLLLGRLAGVEDLVVGMPVALRQEPGTESLIGLFLNHVALRTDLSGDPTFRELLERVNARTIEALVHIDLPFGRIVAEIRPGGEAHHSPIFQVLINHLDLGDGPLLLPGITADPILRRRVDSKYDITLYLRPTADGIRLWLSYRSPLFSEDRMLGLLSQFMGLLSQIAANPDRSIREYSLLTEQFRKTLPDPRAPLEEPPQESVPEAFRRIVLEFPDHAALRHSGQSWSYRDLAGEVAALGARLGEAGVHPGAVVAVCGPSSPGLVAASLAVWQAGGVLLTLDPKLPAARRERMLALARATHLVVIESKVCFPAFEEGLAGMVRIGVDAIFPARADFAMDSLSAGIPPPTAAYVFFTSGTTGTPKAILGTHAGLAHFLHWQRSTFGIGPGDRVAQVTGLSFDVVLRDLFLPLTSGATLCLPSPEGDLAPDRVLLWMAQERITLLHVVPALASVWLGAVPRGVTLESLRWVFFAGEPLTDILVQQWRRAFPGRTGIVNLYGPTETTLAKCCFVVPDPPPPGVQPIGHAIPGAQAWILNDAGRRCGVGEPGEIVLRTPFRSLGYLDESGDLQGGFRPNPFRQDPLDRVYFTGDQGRFRPDGLLEIIGRRDDQTKISGVRVEPGEVNAVMRLHPGIHASVVIAVKRANEPARLAAYLVPREPGSPPTSRELRRFLGQCLPESMVPSVFVVLAALPLSPNGKVDRSALPSPEMDRSDSTESQARPWTVPEELLAAIWAEALGRGQVGLHDDFFDLGGHSLLAMRVVARIRNAFSIELPVRALFEHRTLSGLAEQIGRARLASAAVSPLPLHVRPPGVPVPLSFAQERLWFLTRLDPHGSVYHLPYGLRLRGRLDAVALEKALGELIQRHEVLRTLLVSLEGEPEQRIRLESDFHLEIVDLRMLPEEQRTSEARRGSREFASQPFDLSRDLMLRARLVRWADDQHDLLLTVHHIASDGWSMGVFARELTALYSAFTEGKPSPLPELPLQYADYAVWQRQWFQGEVLERQLAYWKRQLAGAPTDLLLPTDFPRPALLSYRGARHPIVFDRERTQAVKALGHRENATPFMVLLAAWQVLLARYSGQVDLCVGSPIAGRTRTEIEGLIGFFANTLVLRTDLSGNPTFRELLRKVRETTLDAFAHQDLPFEKLVAELSPQRSLSHPPLFQVTFALQNAPSAPLELPGTTAEQLELQNDTCKFELTLALAERDGQLRGTLEYSTDLFEAATIDRMIGHYQSLLDNVVQDAGQPMGVLPMLSADERHRLLHEWSQTPAGPPTGDGRPATSAHASLNALFEAQVCRTPDAVAVVFGSEFLTYRELNTQAQRLAEQLHRVGAGPDIPVGLCLERSVSLAIGLLGILKAGSAYVPLDPAYPRQRLEVMVREAALRLFVTQESLRPLLPTASGWVISLDDLQRPTVSEAMEGPLPEALPEHLAYVMFTSGSTGIPKGVAMPHRALVNLVAWHLADPRLGRPARTLQFASCNFDVSFQEMLTTWCSGGTLVMIPESARRDPEALWQILVEMEVERMFLPFIALQQLAAWAPESVLKKSRLRDILSAGETLRLTAEIRRLAFGLGECRFHNHYGPTESHVVTAHVLSGSPLDWPSTAPIGRPIANTRIHLLDPWRQPVPIGVTGELHIGGASLARGYIGRPDLTAERFVSSPLGDAPDTCLYQTGDLARWRSDGVLEFLGRRDDQVKIRGFRVEPAEIENTLRRHPAVKEAWVVVRPGPDGGKRLAAWCQTSPDATVGAAELREFLRLSLPDYMVPAVFVSAKHVPLTPNGKVDASAVPMESDQIASWTDPVSETTAEAVLADLWCRLLGVQSVGLDDNFFDLGGHSLLSLQLLEQIQRVFRTRLAPREFFENRTVRSLAVRVWKHVEQPGWAPGHTSNQRLVTLQSHGDRPPIFFFPGGFGDETELIWPAWFSRRHLGPEQPLYALQCPGVDGGRSFPRTLSGEARECLREMRRIQPRGPWFLIGSCLGGNLAYQVARQAQSAGDSVPMLVLADCSRPLRAQYWRQCAAVPKWGLRQYVMNTLFLALPSGRPLLTTAGRHRLLQQWVKRPGDGRTNGPVEFGEEWKWRIFQHGEAVLRRQMSQPQGRFDGRIDLVVSQPNATSERIHQWNRQATQGTKVLVLPGTHSTYLIEGASLLTKLFQQRIEGVP